MLCIMVYISNKNHSLIFNSERLSNSWEGCMWGKLTSTFEPNILILNSSFRQWKYKVSGINIKKKKKIERSFETLSLLRMKVSWKQMTQDLVKLIKYAYGVFTLKWSCSRYWYEMILKRISNLKKKKHAKLER